MVTVSQINGNNLNSINNDTAVVIFSAEWCDSCHSLLDRITHSDIKVPVYNCDVDENEKLANEMNITSLPVIGIYHGGSLVDIMKGARSISDIIKSVRDYIVA